LHLLAGFERATTGEILVNGRPVNGAGADRGVVFQEYCLFPWLSVQRNVEFGLRIRGIPREERAELANRMILRVGLDGFQTALPYQLSGGMKQRCALARCFANNPEVLLLDEPLGAVDALTREELQDEIQRIWWADGEERKCVVNITHSIDEAVYLSDRVVVMSPRPGRVRAIVDVGLPRPRMEHMRVTVGFQELVERIKGTLRERTDVPISSR
jgi:NitT/TauT family transport system ATP-binding protein